jgi:hypothetical protein
MQATEIADAQAVRPNSLRRRYHDSSDRTSRANTIMKTAHPVMALTALISILGWGCASSPAGNGPAAKTPPPAAATAAHSNAVASTSADPKPDSKVAADPKADSKVSCHTEVPSGSHIGVKVCETAAQREARDAAARDMRDQLNRQHSGCPQLGPGGCAGGG